MGAEPPASEEVLVFSNKKIRNFGIDFLKLLLH